MSANGEANGASEGGIGGVAAAAGALAMGVFVGLGWWLVRRRRLALEKRETPHGHPVSVYVVRLLPGMDLLDEINAFVKRKQLKAAFVSASVGSLTQATLRFANRQAASVVRSAQGDDTLEIVSLSGTVAVTGSHLHMSVADSSGSVIGGHVLPGCIVYTTVELVVGVAHALEFSRAPCSKSGFLELEVRET